jgi:hypothetical protein
VLFLGTLFAPTKDRYGAGHAHSDADRNARVALAVARLHPCDIVTVASAELGSPVSHAILPGLRLGDLERGISRESDAPAAALKHDCLDNAALGDARGGEPNNCHPVTLASLFPSLSITWSRTGGQTFPHAMQPLKIDKAARPSLKAPNNVCPLVHRFVGRRPQSKFVRREPNDCANWLVLESCPM